MLPNSVVMNGVTYTPHMTAGNEKTYLNVDSVIAIVLREDSEGRLEERLRCQIGLGPTIDGHWSSFNNEHCRRQFLKVVNAYYDKYPDELPE